MLIPLGLLIGFLASAPPGPINLLALSQAMNHRSWRSISVGVTAALLDIFYCYAAMIGASIFSSLLNRWSAWLRLISILILIVVARHLLLQARSMTSKAFSPPAQTSFPHLIALTFVLYISSPTLAAFWISIAASIIAHGLNTQWGVGPAAFAVSCGAGSLIWYLGLAKYGSRLQRVLSPKLFKTILTALAIVLLGIALLALGRLLLGLV